MAALPQQPATAKPQTPDTSALKRKDRLRDKNTVAIAQPSSATYACGGHKAGCTNWAAMPPNQASAQHVAAVGDTPRIVSED